MELVRFSFEGRRFKHHFCISLSEVPESDLPLLSDRDELVVVVRGYSKRVDTTHALRVAADSLLGFEVPAEDRTVTSAGQKMHVIVEELDFGHLGGVLLQVGD